MQVFFQQPANSSGSRLVVAVASFLVPRLSLYIILQHPRHTPKCSCRCILVDVRDTLSHFLSAPFKAALISHENIVYISIVEIMDGVFKLALAIVLLQLRSDKLVTYTIILLFIYLLNFRLFVFCGVALQGMSSFKDYCRLRQASDCRIGKFHQVDYLRYGSSSNTNTGIVNIT